jgi:hypothetical protein
MRGLNWIISSSWNTSCEWPRHGRVRSSHVGSDISEALRNQVAGRADHRCEYCLIHENDTGFRLQVDHVVSCKYDGRKHGGLSVAENLAYACVLCNRSKGTDVASIDRRSGEIVGLFHPRRDRWADHFQLDANPISRFNAPERLAERGLLQALDSYPT